MKVQLRHSTSGVIKKTKLGFSWTFFFFGLWIPLFRGDFKNFFRIWGLSIITLGIYYIISCFTYNKIYLKDLLEKGYIPIDEQTKQTLLAKEIIADIQTANSF